MEELINKHPILYLGFEKLSKTFYFFGSKDGVGRLLKYASYPMWTRGSSQPDFLSLNVELPEAVLMEVLLFVNGRVSYEVQPKRRGRAEKVIRTLTSTEGSKEEEAEVKVPAKGSVKESGGYFQDWCEIIKHTGTRSRRANQKSVQADITTTYRSLTGDPEVVQTKPKRTRKTKQAVTEAELPKVSAKGEQAGKASVRKPGRPRKVSLGGGSPVSGAGFNTNVQSSPARAKPRATAESIRKDLGRRPTTGAAVLADTGVVRKRRKRTPKVRVVE